MANQYPYAATGDISFGDMGVPPYVDLLKVIETAANDVDAVIGTRYKLPLDLDIGNQEHKSAINMLNKITRYFVLGRVVMDQAIGHEETQLHAYALYHIRWAEQALKAIANGDVEIPGQQLLVPDDSKRVTGPIVSNRDAASLVDSFYDIDPYYNRANSSTPFAENW